MNATRKLYSSLLVAALGLSALVTACGDDTTGTGGSGGTGGAGSTSSSKATSGSSTGSSSASSSGSGGSVQPTLTVVNKTPFDPAKGELPEGLAISADAKTAYLGYASTGKIIKVNLADGTVGDFGSVPAPPPMNGGFVLGLAVSAAGDVYVGVASFVPDPTAYVGGIYKIAAAGGAGAVFAKDAGMRFPNGLAFAADGNLFVADSGAGTVFKISPDGKTVTPWATEAQFKGDVAAANKCQSGLGLPIGINGIAVGATEVYVSHTDKGLLFKIPIKADKTADKATTLVTSDPATCAPLKGADGIALDGNGDILVAANGANELVRVAKDGGKTTTLIAKDKFDSPASVVYLAATKQALISNFAVATALAGGTPKPGLLITGPLP